MHHYSPAVVCLWLFVQLELYSALSLDYAVVVAMSCFCMCYANNTMIIISGSSVQFNYTHCTWSDNSHHSEEAVAILEL